MHRVLLWAQRALVINDHLPRPMLASSCRHGGSENLAAGLFQVSAGQDMNLGGLTR